MRHIWAKTVLGTYLVRSLKAPSTLLQDGAFIQVMCTGHLENVLLERDLLLHFSVPITQNVNVSND